MAWIIIWTACTGIAVIFLLWKLWYFKREVYDYTEQLEQWLDDIISDKEITQVDEDTLQSKISEKINRINRIFQRKKEETLKEKKSIQEIISDISHQTKTPIANMKLYLELLKEEPISEKGTIFIENLESQTDRLNFLFQSMVKMSRMETGIIKIQQGQANLSETLGKAVAAIVPKAEKKQIQLFVQCGEDILINHDKKWTAEAIFNILDNAVKYTNAGGNIKITVTVLEIYTRISIQDSGKGIAIERQAEIFQRFYREPEVHDQEGIGIGLYLARKIIELQNGYIEVRSQKNHGPNFQIYLLNEFSQ